MSQIKERILVIRLGALGDLIFCFQSFQEIRLAHPEAEIALLTRAPFAAFAGKMPWFNGIIIDTHPTVAQPREWGKLLTQIKSFNPTRIYDLQGKRRQSILYMLLGGPWGPEWSGAAPWCKYPRVWPPAPDMSFRGFLAAQLRLAGVPAAPSADLRWLDAQTGKFGLPEKYAVLIPGSSPAAPQKRWPPQKYAELAALLKQNGLHSVIIGTQTDAEVIAAIKSETADVIDLSCQTNIFELAGVLRRAAYVVGNDTGPIHMAGAVGAPTIALFSCLTSSVWSTPPGDRVVVLRKPNLEDLSVREVYTALHGFS